MTKGNLGPQKYQKLKNKSQTTMHTPGHEHKKKKVSECVTGQEIENNLFQNCSISYPSLVYNCSGDYRDACTQIG